MRKNYQIVTVGCLCEPGSHTNCNDLRTAKIHAILWMHGYSKLSSKLHGCEVIRKWKNPITKKVVREIYIFGDKR